MSSRELQRELQQKGQRLLGELTLFNTYIERAHELVAFSKFAKEVENEVKAISQFDVDQACTSVENGNSTTSVHRLRSSNLSFYETVWNVAKRSRGVTALQRRFKHTANQRSASRSSNGAELPNPMKALSKEHVVVDVVADHGQKWIKIWTKSQDWLLFDMAKEGLVLCQDSSDDENVKSSDTGKVQISDLRLVRMAEDLYEAAQQQRVRHRHPEVHLLLTNVNEGIQAEIDMILSSIRNIGVFVESIDIAVTKGPHQEQDMKDIFARMVCNQNSQEVVLTNPVNVDCTFLVALISDISHVPPANLKIPSHYQGATRRDITRQIESESLSPIVESELYPKLANRDIVCTQTVAHHLRKILQPMGTSNELIRAKIVLGEDQYSRFSCSELIAALQRHSAYTVPSNLHLPIRTIDFDHKKEFAKCVADPLSFQLEISVAQMLIAKPRLTHLNASAFLYGWAQGVVTLSLNRVVASWIRKTIDEILDELESTNSLNKEVQDSFQGPLICTFDRDRSLLGSEKTNPKS